MFYICFNTNIVLCKSFYHKVVIKKIVELGKLIKPVQANQTVVPHVVKTLFQKF